MQDLINPKYDLTDRADHRNAGLYFEDVLLASYNAWDDPEALSQLKYDEYFEPTMDEDGALYDNTSLDPAQLRISADDYYEAEALFARVNARMYIAHLEKRGNPNLRGEDTLHVLVTDGLRHESRYPKHFTAFAPEQEVTAEKLASALDAEYDDKSYTLARQQADGTLADVYTPQTYSLLQNE
jgi:hypothetical protein